MPRIIVFALMAMMVLPIGMLIKAGGLLGLHQS